MRFAWELRYEDKGHPDFALNGINQLEVRASQTTFVENEINVFVAKDAIRFIHPFSNLEALVIKNDSDAEKYKGYVEISEDTNLSFCLKNETNEYTLTESNQFRKT